MQPYVEQVTAALSGAAWPVLALLAEGIVLLALGLAGARLLRRSGAAARHLAWTTALAAALVAPALWWIPGARVPIPFPAGWDVARTARDVAVAARPEATPEAGPGSFRVSAYRGGPAAPAHDLAIASPQITRHRAARPLPVAATPAAAATPALAAAADAPPQQSSSSGGASHDGSTVAASRPAALPVLPTLVLVWAAGTLLLLARLAAAAIGAALLVRRATPVRDREWLALAAALRGELGVRRGVELRTSDEIGSPMACGVVTPIILLPRDAHAWSADERRQALLHELAHVARHDCGTQLLARLARALHWPDPLAWVAVAAQRAEREAACDDVVLAHGARASAYAAQLVSVARGTRGTGASAHWLTAAAVPMARPASPLDARVRHLLATGLRREPVTRGAVLRAAALGTAALLVAAAFRPIPAMARTSPSRAQAPRLVETSSSPGSSPATPEIAPSTLYGRLPVVRITARMPSSAGDTLAGTVARGDDVTWTGALGAGDTLAIENVSGAIRLARAAGKTAEVVAHRGSSSRIRASDIGVRVSRDRRRTTLCTVYPGAERWACGERDGMERSYSCPADTARGRACADAPVTYTVRVPAGVTVVASTIAGAVTGRDLASDVVARSIGGPIDVRTSGTVTGSTMGRFTAVMGRTDWRGVRRLSAGSGLTVVLPRGADNLVLRARSSFGKIASDFPLGFGTPRTFGARATGALGRGGAELSLGSLGGPVRILDAARHSDPDAAAELAYRSPPPAGFGVQVNVPRVNVDVPDVRVDVDVPDFAFGATTSALARAEAARRSAMAAAAQQRAAMAGARAALRSAEIQRDYWARWGERFGKEFAKSFRTEWDSAAFRAEWDSAAFRTGWDSVGRNLGKDPAKQR